MDSQNKLFLDTNRHHLQAIKNGTLRHIQVPRFLQVMKEEFNPGYGNLDETDCVSVAKLVLDTYRHYDEQIINLEKSKA